jgi:hypothetical protein
MQYLTKRDNHGDHRNLALPSARITLLPIMQSAKNGTLIIMGIKKFFMVLLAPLAPKALAFHH